MTLARSTVLSFLSSLALASGALAQDFCAGAVAVGEGSFPFDTTFATDDGAATCAPSGLDYWYLYTPTATGTSVIETCGSTFDTVLAVFDVCGGIELACDDDTCGFQSSVVLPVTVGVPVVLRVAGYASDFGPGTLTITLVPPPPANDGCAAATPIGEGSFPFSSLGATLDGFATCAASDADVWFLYTPGFTGLASICTCGSSFDTVLRVLDGCAGAEVACNDDACDLQSVVGLPVAAGVPLLVRVASFGVGSVGGAGTITIEMTVGVWDETINGGGDAGDLPAGAQVTTGVGPLPSISGLVAVGGDADMYLISIFDPAAFSATTVNCATGGDTQLFIFDTAGVGITHDDDDPTGVGAFRSRIGGTIVAAAGDYYLAISRYDTDPLDPAGSAIWLDMPYGVERAPDGPGAPGPIAGWAGFSGTGAYRIDLTGACYGAPLITCDLNQDGATDFGDVFLLIDIVGGVAPCPACIICDITSDGATDFTDVFVEIDVVGGVVACP